MPEADPIEELRQRREREQRDVTAWRTMAGDLRKRYVRELADNPALAGPARWLAERELSREPAPSPWDIAADVERQRRAAEQDRADLAEARRTRRRRRKP